MKTGDRNKKIDDYYIIINHNIILMIPSHLRKPIDIMYWIENRSIKEIKNKLNLTDIKLKMNY